MKHARILKYLSIFIILLLLIPIVVPTSFAEPFNRKRTIKVAFIWQRWDILDIPAKIGMMIYKKILRDAEKTYDVSFEIYEFWDRWHDGDVQQGKLQKLDIDVVVGPGGFGGWNSPADYRKELKDFVRRGGGFYGICGDSTFGSLGVVNLPRGYQIPLKKATDSWSFTPMLGLANVYTDASAFDQILKYPLWIKKADVIRLAGQLPVSRAAIRIEPVDLPIYAPYFNDRVRVMLGNAPLIEGPRILRLFMPDVYTLAEFKGTDDPYDASIKGKKAIVATYYGQGRVILSVVHPELTIGNDKAHDVFARNILWLDNALPIKERLHDKALFWGSLFIAYKLEHSELWYLFILLNHLRESS
jgi:hypothetical protein